MAALCGHFVAMTHRMLRFLECSYITERKFRKEVSIAMTHRMLRFLECIYITDRKFTRKLVAMTPQTTLVGV